MTNDDVDFSQWTDARANAEFQRILTEHDAATCPTCGKPIDRGDVAWNNSNTESEFGTDYCVLQITCEHCSSEILHLRSWYPSIETFEEFVYVLGWFEDDAEW